MTSSIRKKDPPHKMDRPTTITHSRGPIVSLIFEFKLDLPVISNEQSPEGVNPKMIYQMTELQGLEPQDLDYESTVVVSKIPNTLVTTAVSRIPALRPLCLSRFRRPSS